MTRIIIADDHPIVRRGVKDIILESMEDVVIGEAGNAYETLEWLSRQEWDLAVLDMAMPGLNGLELLKEVKRQRPELPVIILSMHPEGECAMSMLEAGASDYLSKERSSEELIQAIRKALEHRLVLGPDIPRSLVTDSARPSHKKLSRREIEVLRGFSSGKTTGEIAATLSLSRRTISTYRARLLGKLHMRTNAELIRYGILQHLTD
jgi:DNA-binding NarL/FixJ family response regulator